MIYFDLRAETQRKSIGNVVARDLELSRIARTLKRQYNNNVLIRAASGIGKSSLIEGLAYRLAKGAIPGFEQTALIKLDALELRRLFAHLNNTETATHVVSAFKSLPQDNIVFIDDFQTLLDSKNLELGLIFQKFLDQHQSRLVLAVSEAGYQKMLTDHPNFLQNFEEIALKESDSKESQEIIAALAPSFEKQYKIQIQPQAIKTLVELSKKLSSDKRLPLRAIHLLDESLAHAQINNLKALSALSVQEIFAEKTGVPKHSLTASDTKFLGELENRLNENVIGQHAAVRAVSSIIKRGRIGLRNPNKPYGSFLFLGPSGVGKTELSRMLAKTVYGSERAFTRIDMSEFAEAHTVQRLIGAPPGYVGYEQGGQLTSAVAGQPYSLVLLDEIEKAHGKIFDIFLQVFEDGRLTSGQGQTVNFTNSIVIATSNLGINEIVGAYKRGEDIHGQQFLQETLMPILFKHFRLEFLNRFDAILVFNPLQLTDLIRIAMLEIKKIEQRVSEHKIKFNIDQNILARKITQLIDHRFGARPVKRFVEQTCENLIAAKLL